MPPKKGSTKSKKGTKLAVPAAIKENRAPIATVSGTNTNGTEPSPELSIEEQPLAHNTMQRPQRLNKGTRMAGYIKSIKALSDDDGEDVPKKTKGKRQANDSTDTLQGDEDNRNPMAPPSKKQKPIPNLKQVRKDPPLVVQQPRPSKAPVLHQSQSTNPLSRHNVESSVQQPQLADAPVQPTVHRSSKPPPVQHKTHSAQPAAHTATASGPRSAESDSQRQLPSSTRLGLVPSVDCQPVQPGLDPDHPRTPSKDTAHRSVGPELSPHHDFEDMYADSDGHDIGDGIAAGMDVDHDNNIEFEAMDEDDGDWRERRSEPDLDDYNDNPFIQQESQIQNRDFEIDEESPDEDERRAQAALHSPEPNVPTQKMTTATDVLEAYRKKNKAVRPPSDEKLRDAARHQLQRAASDKQLHEDDKPQAEDEGGSDGDTEDDDEGENRGKRRAPRNSKQNGKISAKTLRYYTGTWKAMLNTTKKRFRGYVVFTNPFPSTEDHMDEAMALISEVKAEFEADGRMFDPAICKTEDMGTLVLKEAATYRCRMKTACRETIPIYYPSAISPNCDGGNQLEYYGVVKREVHNLLTHRTKPFHIDGKDENGKTNNFMHPSIKDLCIRLFYNDGRQSLARTFDEFKTSVPERAVILAATCVYHAIDEYRDGGYRINKEFSAENYSRTYKGLIHSLEILKQDPYHREKWIRVRREWAEVGMYIMNPPDEEESITDIPVILD